MINPEGGYLQTVPTFFIGKTELRGVRSKEANEQIIDQELSKRNPILT